MYAKIIPTVKNIALKLFASLNRFPETLTLTTAIVIIHIFLHHLDYSMDTDSLRDILVRISMVLALGVPLFLSLKLVFERMPLMSNLLKTMLYLGIISGLILYYFFLLKEIVMVPLSRYIAYSFACYLMFLLIPYFIKRENFEIYCVQLLTNFAVTYFYASILYLGLAAIIFTISKLFLVGNNKIYFDIWLMVTGIFAPAYFLADIPSYKKEFQAAEYSKILKILLLYIIVPLLIIYSLILYAYFIKITITRTWPEGIISHLTLWYSLISCVVMFLIYPFRSSIKWIAKFLTIFPKLMIPLLIMMFVSMGIRIQNYGITENRYFVLLAGIWVTGILLYYLFAKRINNILLPFSLSLIAIISVTGPWNAYSISKLSQSNRFTALLTKYKMIQNNTIVKPNRQLEKADKVEIISIMNYFDRFHSIKDLKILPPGFELNQTPKIFGFEINKDDLKSRHYQSYFGHEFPKNQLFKITGYDYFINISHSDVTKVVVKENINISYGVDNNMLVITMEDKEIYRRNVHDLIIPLIKEKTADKRDSLNFPDENKQIKVLYIINNFSGHTSKITDDVEINYLDFLVFIKFK